jgi:hypothetical protein
MPLHSQKYDRAFVVINGAAAGWAKAQMAEIASALRFIGIDAVQLDFNAVVSTLSPLKRDSYFVVDANNLVEFNDPVRKFSFMFDHPCYLWKRLKGIERPSITTGWVDAGHVGDLAATGLAAHSVFLPHAGPDLALRRLPMRERDIDVLFAGSLGEPIDRPSWAARHADVPAIIADIIFDTAAAIETTLDPVLHVFTAICAQRGINIGQVFSREAFCTLIGEIMRIAEVNRRNAILEALPEVKICVVSNHLPARLRDRTNIHYVEHTDDFSAVRSLMARSKIVLNATGKFPRGSHERIWYGIAEGAAVLTDPSLFVQSFFKHDESIFFLPLRKTTPQDLDDCRSLIDDPSRLDAIAQQGAELYARQHSWKQRITILNETIQDRPPRLAA